MDPSGKRVLHHPAEDSQAGWAGRGGNAWYSCPIPNLTLRQKTTSAGIMQTHNSYFDDKTETPPPSCLLGWVTAMAPPNLLCSSIIAYYTRTPRTFSHGKIVLNHTIPTVVILLNLVQWLLRYGPIFG